MSRGAVLLLFASCFAYPVAAWEARLLDSHGAAVVSAQVTVVERRITTRTDAHGRFTLLPSPPLPARLIIVGSRGELHPPLVITSLEPELRLSSAYRESVTVSSGATPNIAGTPASAARIYGAEEIEQRKPSHVADLIASTPGVSVRGEGPPAVPIIRGLAGGRTLLLIDDARIVSERRAGASATFVNPMSLGSIELVRGPGSVAYGSDALGGVVHLRPRDPVAGAPDYRYELWSSFGAEEATGLAAELSADVAGGALLVAVHGRMAGDSSDARGETIVNSQYRDRGAFVRFVRDTSWGRMRLGVLTSASRDVGAPTRDPVLTLYPDERVTLLTFGADLYEGALWNSASLRASLGSSSVVTERIRPSGVEQSAVKARDASLRFSFEHAFGDSRVVAGADAVSRFDLRAGEAVVDADRLDGGLFLTWARPWSRLDLSAGARADAISSRNSGGYFGDRERDDVALSGFAAATAVLLPSVSATLQFSSGYREPTLSDRYFRGIGGRGFITGNPELEPERSLQLDGGVRWSNARSAVALYLYEYRIRDLVERYRVGADFAFRNRGEAVLRGVELEASTRPLAHLELQAGVTVARGEDRASGDPLDDVAPLSVQLSARWASAHASLFALASAFARDDRPGPVEVDRPGYAEVDLGAGWRFSDHFELRVVVQNALDRQHHGSPDAAAAFAPGRSVVIGVNR